MNKIEKQTWDGDYKLDMAEQISNAHTVIEDRKLYLLMSKLIKAWTGQNTFEEFLKTFIKYGKAAQEITAVGMNEKRSKEVSFSGFDGCVGYRCVEPDCFAEISPATVRYYRNNYGKNYWRYVLCYDHQGMKGGGKNG